MKNILYCIRVTDGQDSQIYKFGYDWRGNLVTVLMNSEAAKSRMEFETWEEEVVDN